MSNEQELDAEYLRMRQDVYDYWEQQEETVTIDKVGDGGMVLYTTEDGRFESDQRQVILMWIMLQPPKPAIRLLRRLLEDVEEKYDTTSSELRFSIIEDVIYQLSIVQKKLQREAQQ